MLLVNGPPSSIKGWMFEDIHLEMRYGNPTLVPPHSHDTYQIGFTTRDPGLYYSDGREWVAPPGSVVLFHPGEIHKVVARRSVRVASVPARMMFLTQERVRGIASDVSGKQLEPPFFSNRVIRDGWFVNHFVRVHKLLGMNVSILEKQSGLLELFERLVTSYASNMPTRVVRDKGRDRAMASVVREFIDAHYDANLSLPQLAALVHASLFHMHRTFKREVGMPPHAYQIQVRIDKAKSLLVRGMSVTEVAAHTGFFDQSHFTRHFHRIVGVSPGGYTRPI